MSAINQMRLIDPMEKYVVNDDVILFEDTESNLAVDNCTEYYDNKSIFNYDNYDGKICMLIDVLCYCGTLEPDNREVVDIIVNLMPYITKEKPSFDELMTHPIIPKLISYFEKVDIKNDDSMFMAYYRLLRYLKS